MKKGWNVRRFCVYILTGMLVVGLLILTPILAVAKGGEELSPTGISGDPLGRLPATPEDAHRKLLERKIGWPEDEPAEVSGASVKPGVNVSLPFDSVEGHITHPNANVKVEVIGKGTLTVKSNEAGWFNADFNAAGVDIKSGDQVKVTDLADSQSLTLNCKIEGTIDYNGDKVTGKSSGTRVKAYVITPNTYYGDIPPGAFSAEATVSGGAYTVNMNNSFNLMPGDAVLLYSIDA